MPYLKTTPKSAGLKFWSCGYASTFLLSPWPFPLDLSWFLALIQGKSSLSLRATLCLQTLMKRPASWDDRLVNIGIFKVLNFRKFYHFLAAEVRPLPAEFTGWYQLTAQAIRAERPEDMCLAIARAKAGHWNQRVSPGFGIIFSSKPYHGYHFLARRQKETRLSMEKFDCWWFRGVSRGTFTLQQPLQVVPMPQPQIQGKLQQADALVPKVAKDALLVCMDQADWWWLGCFCISFFSFKPWKRWRCAMVVSEKSRKVRKRQGCRNFYWSFLKGREGACFPFSGSVYDIFSLWRRCHGRPGISWSRTGKGNLPPSWMAWWCTIPQLEGELGFSSLF